jgi:uncharacterized protein (TIGR02996 family)
MATATRAKPDRMYRAFSIAVIRNPQDAATRGAFADWLDENNHPEEAKIQRELMDWQQHLDAYCKQTKQHVIGATRHYVKLAHTSGVQWRQIRKRDGAVLCNAGGVLFPPRKMLLIPRGKPVDCNITLYGKKGAMPPAEENT